MGIGYGSWDCAEEQREFEAKRGVPISREAIDAANDIASRRLIDFHPPDVSDEDFAAAVKALADDD